MRDNDRSEERPEWALGKVTAGAGDGAGMKPRVSLPGVARSRTSFGQPTEKFSRQLERGEPAAARQNVAFGPEDKRQQEVRSSCAGTELELTNFF